MDTALTVLTLFCAMLVLLMTPALMMFYGGLSRKKNVGNTMIMAISAIGIVSVVWVICGYSIAFDTQFSPEQGGLVGQFIGGFGQLFLNGTDTMAEGSFVDGLPDMAFAAFQCAFATITVCIIIGAASGRMKFGAMVCFLVLWVLFIYGPLAHMVWGGGLIGETIGAIDFAGGDVVHISSGVTGLVLCILIGKRRGFGNVAYRAHNVPLVASGAGILWFGWLGFNAGSALAIDDGVAALALMNTVVASGSAMLSWMVVDKVVTGHSTLVGASTGMVAGLVVITPAAGFVHAWAALVMGIIVSPVCFFAIASLKKKFGYDDALDAFGLHGVGGILGGILTGLFCVPELSWTDFGGLLYTGDPSLFISQLLGIVVTLVLVVIGTLVIGLIVKALFKGSLAVSTAEEGQGMDVAIHGENAYPAFDGLD